MDFLNCFKVAIEISTQQLVIYKQCLLCSQVLFENGDTWTVAERGGISNFEIIGDF